MPQLELDALLESADPQSAELTADVLASVALLADATQRAARPRRRRRVWIPVASVAAILLSAGTGAAVATDFFHDWRVHLEIDGEVIDKVVDADVVIPITFTTDSGDVVSCTYALAYVWGETDPLREFVASHDWSGLGQRAYEHHLAEPHYPKSVTEIDENGNRTELTAEEIRAQGPVFAYAIDAVFAEELPADLRDDEYVSQGSTDCEGKAQ